MTLESHEQPQDAQLRALLTWLSANGVSWHPKLIVKRIAPNLEKEEDNRALEQTIINVTGIGFQGKGRVLGI